MDAVFADPQVQHVGIVAEVDSPRRGLQKVLGQAISLSGAEALMRLPTPEAGEHTDAVMAELGYDGAQIETLKAKGVI